MNQVRIKYSIFEVGDTIRHRRRRHVRREIVSFEQGLPWTFRIRADGSFYPEAKALLLTRVEEWELVNGEA